MADGWFYSTFIDPIIVSVTVFKIFHVIFNDLELEGLKATLGQSL